MSKNAGEGMKDESGSGEILSQLDDLEKAIGTFSPPSVKTSSLHKALIEGSVGCWQWNITASEIEIDQTLAGLLNTGSSRTHKTWAALLGKKNAGEFEKEIGEEDDGSTPNYIVDSGDPENVKCPTGGFIFCHIRLNFSGTRDIG